MYEINLQDAEDIAGSGFFFNWAAGRILTAGAEYVWGAVMSGQVDYAGLAETQGTYYNMVGS